MTSLFATSRRWPRELVGRARRVGASARCSCGAETTSHYGEFTACLDCALRVRHIEGLRIAVHARWAAAMPGAPPLSAVDRTLVTNLLRRRVDDLGTAASAAMIAAWAAEWEAVTGWRPEN